MATRSAEAGLAAEVRHFTDLRRPAFNQEHAPARSAGLITAEASEAFPPAGDQALEVCLGGGVPMAAAVDHITDPVWLRESRSRNLKWRRTSCCTTFRIFFKWHATAM